MEDVINTKKIAVIENSICNYIQYTEEVKKE